MKVGTVWTMNAAAYRVRLTPVFRVCLIAKKVSRQGPENVRAAFKVSSSPEFRSFVLIRKSASHQLAPVKFVDLSTWTFAKCVPVRLALVKLVESRLHFAKFACVRFAFDKHSNSTFNRDGSRLVFVSQNIVYVLKSKIQ